MKIKLPKTYQELLEQVRIYQDVQVLEPDVHYKGTGLGSLTTNAQAPVFYVVDYVQGKYLYVDPSCQTLLGYEVQKIAEDGPVAFTSLWHRNDFKVYNEQIFPQIMGFLKAQSLNSVPNYSFSFNYRIATKSGNYISVLQRSTYYLAAADKTPLAAVGFIIDISHFKEDCKIVFTIERIDRNYNILSKAPLFKSVFHPDKVSDVLSKREVQVLQCIHDGMSSKQIADKLFISLNTINNHRKNMLEKTHSKNTADLLHYATKHGIL